MPLGPLEVQKKGLKTLQAQVKAKKEKLQAQLHEKKSISSLDEKWLDNEANLVDEQQVLEALMSHGLSMRQQMKQYARLCWMREKHRKRG